MPNDAKLGLVVGVGVVIAIGVVYYRKEPAPTPPPGTTAPAASTAAPAPVVGSRGQYRPARGRTVVRSELASSRPLLHVVEEGDTLSLLAERYFGNSEMQSAIRHANATLLQASERLTPGMELVIPELP